MAQKGKGKQRGGRGRGGKSPQVELDEDDEEIPVTGSTEEEAAFRASFGRTHSGSMDEFRDPCIDSEEFNENGAPTELNFDCD